jgi:kinesin family protein C2/C3
MEGSASDPGVNIRALEHLFSLLAARSSSPDETGAQRYSATVRMSALEIYNETPRDLLVDPREYRKSLGAAADSVAASNAKLEVHQHPDGSIFVPGLTERPVSCVADITALVASHVRPNRATAATAMNEYSSRSHSIIFIKVETSCSSPAGEGEVERTHGRLVLIDLAGSERVKKSEAQGQALKEASHM